MADAPYLVCLALLHRGGQRALPLTGRSWSQGAAGGAEDPGEEGQRLALELLLRLWQGSEETPLQRAAADDSLLLLEMPLEQMSQQLPLLKASWLSRGDTAVLLAGLKGLAHRGWRISVAKYEPIRFSPWA
jgi:hypothetical protein